MIRQLIEQHRRLEVSLDALLAMLGPTPQARTELGSRFHDAASIALAHYDFEDRGLFDSLRSEMPAFVAKLEAQHDEVRELSQAVTELLRADVMGERERSDLLLLCRRFVAMAQHNIIEEERDFFPLVAIRNTSGWGA
ncbi:MAG: hemerythrin domain-containing protein [Bryobacteraceae bacterium]|nr:hemerythrin domain-containing protein [Bryobacterales bacterium]MEB2362199.1 hemerythrin domain-containing protein [Bryobacterales bacterium]NUN00899.1 hemerythrin domain-containing protein [Bryobacteraceae bacterium]